MRVKAFLEASALLMLLAGAAAAAPGGRGDWPQFRGAHQDGRATDKGVLLREWPAEGPKLLWRQPIGEAYASVVAVGDRLYTATSEKETEIALALDANTGKEIWRQPIGPIFVQTEFGSGTRASATYDGELIYIISGIGRLYALKTADGAVVWNTDLLATFGAGQPRFGYSASALVVGDLLIVDAGGAAGKGVVAFDKKKGDVKWTAIDSKAAHYATPVLVEIGGVPQILIARREDPELVALGLDGKQLWGHRGLPSGIASPVLVPPDKLFVSSANDGAGFLLQVKNEGGKFTIEEVWRNAVLKSHFHAAVAVDGLLIGFDNANLKCVDATTGAQKWAARGFGKGSVIEADGLLIVLADDGRVALADFSAEGFRSKSEFQATNGGKSWTAPTVAGGRLYIRDFDEIVAYDIAAQGAAAQGAAAPKGAGA